MLNKCAHIVVRARVVQHQADGAGTRIGFRYNRIETGSSRAEVSGERRHVR